MPGCAQAGRVFVGQRDESFAVNLGHVFDLVNFAPVDADVADQGGTRRTARALANDIIADQNITTLALECPSRCLTGAATA